MIKFQLILLASFVALLSIALGCDSKDPSAVQNSTTASTSPDAQASPSAPSSPSAAPTQSPAAVPTAPTKADLPTYKSSGLDKPPADGEPVAVISTNLGDIVLKFFPDKAPNHVANFMKLAKANFYNETKFHRVIPGFMIQGGDPNTKPGGDTIGPPGAGGPGYTINAEFNDVHHKKGILSMARSQDPNSAGSQFFICVADADSLDNQYTAFGQVVSGQDVVDKIVSLPTGEKQQDMPNPGHEAVMKSVKITTWPIQSGSSTSGKK